ncbi:flagellar basal body rod protein FlgB [Ideonella sp. B7]|uniref:flagellar basal body rod protein FlgB n=1 Tax=Ideonella benzenivorans TaxID=2831643 RepID=UPI001CEDF0E8|nr:flagellar basal body rod protein FlgB [Ideonella benzenivorans]MCA6217960.1 flagellar basal body rod protein FlgB [Ideonella benzenivorans]
MLNRLTQSMDFQAQALSLRAERQRLLASNIANADTPGYVAREMDFAQALRQATGAVPVPGQMNVTQAGHIQPPAGALSESGLRYALNSQTSLDSNTVDMDRERASFAENSVKYEATLRFLNSQIKNVLDAMKSANQG